MSRRRSRPEESHNSRPLPRTASEQLERLWHRLQDGPVVSRSELRDTARQVSIAAHRANLNATELIIALKVSWIRGGAWRAVGDRQRLHGVLADVISMCIADYYLVHVDPPAPRERRSPGYARQAE